MVFIVTPNILVVATMVFRTCIMEVPCTSKNTMALFAQCCPQVQRNTVAIYHGKVMVLDGKTMVLYVHHSIYHSTYRYSKHISNYQGISDMYHGSTMHFQKYHGTIYTVLSTWTKKYCSDLPW